MLKTKAHFGFQGVIYRLRNSRRWPVVKEACAKKLNPLSIYNALGLNSVALYVLCVSQDLGASK